MNITFQPLKNTGYRPQVTTQSKHTPRTEKTKGDYDTVNIRKPQAAQDDEESFARMLAQRTAAQIGNGASPERVKDLSRRIAEGAYQPNAQRIAGRLLGLS